MNNPLKAVLPIILMATPLLGLDARFGLQLGLVIPQGDAGTALGTKQGFSGGFNVPIDFSGGGSTFRPHLIFTSYSGTQHVGQFASIDNTIFTASLGFDWLYHFNKSKDGLYLIVGVGGDYSKRDYQWNASNDILSDGYHGSNYESGAAFNAGLGWQFSPKSGVEVQYHYATEKFNSGPSYINNYSNLDFSYTFRF